MARMFLSVLGLCALVDAIVALSFAIAAWLAGMGLFGTCREGSCAYGALFVGTPLVSAILCAILFAIWRSRRRHRPADPGNHRRPE